MAPNRRRSKHALGILFCMCGTWPIQRLLTRNLMATVDDPETRELLGDISRVSRSICKTIQSVEKIFDQMKT